MMWARTACACDFQVLRLQCPPRVRHAPMVGTTIHSHSLLRCCGVDHGTERAGNVRLWNVDKFLAWKELLLVPSSLQHTDMLDTVLSAAARGSLWTV